MAALDWSQCPVVESVPGRRSGAWVFRGTRMPVATVFENLEAGASIEEIVEQFHVTPEQIRTVLAFAARQHCYRGERGKARRLHRSGDSQAISPAAGLLRTSYIAGRLASATCVGSSGGFAGRILCFGILVCLLLESSMSLA